MQALVNFLSGLFGPTTFEAAAAPSPIFGAARLSAIGTWRLSTTARLKRLAGSARKL